MTKFMPQEIEVWYLLPAIRRELSIILASHDHLKQNEIAALLGITEAAVSQYKSLKRGNDLVFNAKEKETIKEYAKRISSDKKRTSEIIYELCVKLRGTKSMCELHRKHDKNISSVCTLCKE